MQVEQKIEKKEPFKKTYIFAMEFIEADKGGKGGVLETYANNRVGPLERRILAKD